MSHQQQQFAPPPGPPPQQGDTVPQQPLPSQQQKTTQPNPQVEAEKIKLWTSIVNFCRKAIGCVEKTETLREKREELEQKKREAEAQAMNHYASNEMTST
ncbi:7734_t:CDS:2 [Ambispora leptoticha]|uniref:7734_t:CDS:1 n=1 Tax=Ambispora leptoticha TaxID=144679 RepID=A0A9N8ZNU5_9GLOM|nr:7734_t:CDS:2 [Ambispora leptoticha]